METEMIEISVEISDTTTYDINIPKVIFPDTYPEVMKRLKAVIGMIPVTSLDMNPNLPNVLLRLEEEETADVIRIYETTTQETFDTYLKEHYKLEKRSRANTTSLIGRMRKRLMGMRGGKAGTHGKV